MRLDELFAGFVAYKLLIRKTKKLELSMGAPATQETPKEYTAASNAVLAAIKIYFLKVQSFAI